MEREMEKRGTFIRFFKNFKGDPSEAPFLISFLIVLILRTGEKLFLVPYFLTNDDIDGLMIAKGVGFALRPDGHLFFSNALLGLLLKKCYLLFPSPSWYGYGQILGQFISFWALLSGFFLRSRRWFSAVFFGISFLLMGLYFFCQLNFTILSIVAFQAGVLLLSNLWEEDRAPFRAKILVLGGACVLLSSLVRVEGFLFAALAAAPFIAGTAWSNRDKPVRLLWIFPVLFLIWGSALFDHYYYEGDARWGEFLRFYHSTVNYFVFGHFEYDDKSKIFFDSVGWTQNDFHLFKSFYLLDHDLFSAERIKNLGSHFPLYGFQGWKDSFSSFVGHFCLTSPITKRNYLSYLTSQNALICFVVFSISPRLIRPGPLDSLNAFWVLSLVLFLVFHGASPFGRGFSCRLSSSSFPWRVFTPLRPNSTRSGTRFAPFPDFL